jgi:hypothetical protein
VLGAARADDTVAIDAIAPDPPAWSPVIPYAPPDEAPPMVAAEVRNMEFLGEALPVAHVWRAPVVPPPAEQGWPRCELAPADFAPGGPVAVALAFASKDDTRPNLNAVCLSDHASATDGHVLARRPLASGPGVQAPILLPVPMAHALCSMVAKTRPERLSVKRATAKDGGDQVWFTARTPDGSRWTLAGKCPDAAIAPPYATVAERGARAGSTVRFKVDASEMRALVASLGTGTVKWTIALFTDGGMVAYTSPGEGVALSLASYPQGEPACSMLWGALGKVLARLPKGEIPVEVTANDCGIYLADDRDVVMPMRGGETLPDWVRAEVRQSFGLGARAPSARRVETPAPAYVPPTGSTVFHLGEPTDEDRARAPGMLAPADHRHGDPNAIRVKIDTWTDAGGKVRIRFAPAAPLASAAPAASPAPEAPRPAPPLTSPAPNPMPPAPATEAGTPWGLAA